MQTHATCVSKPRQAAAGRSKAICPGPLEPASGTGAAVTRVRANRNQSTAPRTAELRLGGQALRLRQAGGGEPPTPPQPPRGAVCSYSVTPVEAYVASRGGTGTVTVSAPPECTWTATSALPHARILRGASGSGPGVIEFEVESNPVVYVVDFRKVAIEVRWPTPTAGQNVWLSQFGDCGGAGSVQNYTVLCRRRTDRPERARGVALQLSVARGGGRKLAVVCVPSDRSHQPWRRQPARRRRAEYDWPTTFDDTARRRADLRDHAARAMIVVSGETPATLTRRARVRSPSDLQ